MAKRGKKKAERQDVGRTDDKPNPWQGLIDQTAATRWEKGQSGNPAGPEPKGHFSKLLDQFLMGRVEAMEGAPPRLLKLVQAACDSAETDGSILREILLRFDGPVEKDKAEAMPAINVSIQQVVFAGQAPIPPQQVVDATTLPSSSRPKSRRKPLNVQIERKGRNFEEPETVQLPDVEESDED